MHTRVEEKIGRDYKIDYLTLAEWLLEHTAIETEDLDSHTKQKNVSGFIDYTIAGFKHDVGPVPFVQILARQATSQINDPIRCLGTLDLLSYPNEFDFVDPSGEVLIPRGTPIAEILIPKIDFHSSKGSSITPGMINKSLGLVADYIGAYDLGSEFVLGITHPRLGNLAAKRWRFLIVEHPFPPEVYDFIDLNLQNTKMPQEAARSLAILRRQVLVYQPKTKFIDNFFVPTPGTHPRGGRN